MAAVNEEIRIVGKFDKEKRRHVVICAAFGLTVESDSFSEAIASIESQIEEKILQGVSPLPPS